MQRKRELDDFDIEIVKAAGLLLKKLAQADSTPPAQVVSIAKMQHVLLGLPRITSKVDVSLSLSSPRRSFGSSGTRTFWEINVEDTGRVAISLGGFYDSDESGGDTFDTMYWSISPGSKSRFDDYSGSQWMVPDVRPFAESVDEIDLAEPGYSLDLYDNENPLIEGYGEPVVGEEDLVEDDDEDDLDEEDGLLDDEQEQGDRWDGSTADPPWSITPIDVTEETLAAGVNGKEVSDSRRDYFEEANRCDFCFTDLARKGLFVDGRLRSGARWANMCARCFGANGEGIGWGVGQLYARQLDGRWLLVSGRMPIDPERGGLAI